MSGLCLKTVSSSVRESSPRNTLRLMEPGTTHIKPDHKWSFSAAVGLLEG